MAYGIASAISNFPIPEFESAVCEDFLTWHQLCSTQKAMTNNWTKVPSKSQTGRQPSTAGMIAPIYSHATFNIGRRLKKMFKPCYKLKAWIHYNNATQWMYICLENSVMQGPEMEIQPTKL